MKIFTKKGTLQKTTIVILMIFCINFITPTYSHAVDWSGMGGVLASPIVDFFCSIGDVIINLLQRSMTGEWGSAGAANMSLSAFLMDSKEYYSSAHYTPATGTASESNKIDPENDFDKGWLNLKDEYYIPIATYSPEQIFAGKVPGLDINFIKPNYENGSAALLQPTIAGWYVALRNLAVVGLLCVLVYVGIRIMLSSTAADKSKYKQMFTDWLIALCILFFMHYIMSFVLTLTESICTAITGNGAYEINVEDQSAGKSFSTNLLGLARFKTQYKDFGQKFTYFIFYMALVAYTAIFTWHYLKRLLMMAFLTIIAPMVSFTYPIDKIGDGKAQAFNMWLKEYIYNALIQPFHLIIYMVFVGSAMELVETKLLYAIVVMGFILPAEKILKKMFGFDRAPLGTMGALTGFTLGSLFGKGGSGKGGSSKVNKGENDDASGDKTPRYERKHGTDGIHYDNNRNINDSETNSNNKDNQNNQNNDNGDNDDIVNRSRQEFEDANNNDGNVNFTDNDQDTSTDNNNDNDSEEGNASRTADSNSRGSSNESGKTSEKTSSKGKFRTGVNNIISAHGGGKRIALKGAKTLGNAAKFTTRTAMKLGGMAAGAGIGLASGKGLAGVAAGATAGSRLGSSLGNKMANLPGNIAGGVAGGVKGALSTGRSTIDAFNGNTELQDKAKAKAFFKDESTEQYIRDKWTKEHNGTAPTREEIKAEKDAMKDYVAEGLTDAAAIYRARKGEKLTSAKQSAKIAALAKDRNITSKELGDEKEYNRRIKDFTQEFIDKGLSEADAARNANYVLNVMKAQVGQSYNTNWKNASSAPTNTRGNSNSGRSTNGSRRTNNTNSSRGRNSKGSRRKK